VDPVTQPLTADGFLGPARVPQRGVTASSAGASIYAANSPVRPSLRIRTVITWTWPTLRRSTNRRRTRTALSPCRTIARTTSAVGRATRLNHRSHSDRPNGADAVVEDHPRRRAGLACIGRRCDPARMAAAVRAPSGAATHLRIIRASRHNKLSGSAEPPNQRQPEWSFLRTPSLVRITASKPACHQRPGRVHLICRDLLSSGRVRRPSWLYRGGRLVLRCCCGW
jgi:hypothetical protein